MHLLLINGWIQNVNSCQELTEKWPVYVPWVLGRRIDVKVVFTENSKLRAM